MKTMTKIIVGMGLGCTIPIITGLTVVLFATTSQQTTLTQLYSKIPAALSNTYLEAAILQNEPEEAVAILRKQASYVRMLGNNNLMKKGLVEDTYMVFESQITSHGYLALSNWIDELQQLLGNYDSYWFRVMKEHVDAVVDKNASTDSEYEIASVFPAFDRPYRPRIENAIHQKNYSKLKEWCQEYDEAKYNFLAINPYSRNRYLRAVYDGSIMLLAESDKLQMAESDFHPAFLTDDFVPYKFTVKRQSESRMLRLSFRSVPGIRMRLESITFQQGQNRDIYSQNDLLYIGKSGFILDDGSYLLADNMQADVLTIYPRDGLFPRSEIIIISLRFEKLPFVNHEYCQSTRSTG